MKSFLAKHKTLLLMGLLTIGAVGSVVFSMFFNQQATPSVSLTGSAIGGRIPATKTPIRPEAPTPGGGASGLVEPPAVGMKGVIPGDEAKTPKSYSRKAVLPRRDTTGLFYPPDQDGVDTCKDVAPWVVEAMSLDQDMVVLGRDRIRSEWLKHLSTSKSSQWDSPWFEGMRTNFWQYTGLDSKDWGKEIKDKGLKVTQNVVATKPMELDDISAFWGAQKYDAMFWPQTVLGLQVCEVTTSKNITQSGQAPEDAQLQEQHWGVAINTKTGSKKNWEVEGIWLM
ncbi:hypothetical protein FYZ41_03395 [Mobiluncus mulieris]|uniref:hypothetical protein n=1 Tax=Mobiluncus mulieris TaxID=2052 RepID=UPI0021E1D9A4|nr:hypothetical protein [Mobiluncus mulieris]MCV0011231.1 hypothetical protein [Mobiluncus mulieris]